MITSLYWMERCLFSNLNAHVFQSISFFSFYNFALISFLHLSNICFPLFPSPLYLRSIFSSLCLPFHWFMPLWRPFFTPLILYIISSWLPQSALFNLTHQCIIFLIILSVTPRIATNTLAVYPRQTSSNSATACPICCSSSTNGRYSCAVAKPLAVLVACGSRTISSTHLLYTHDTRISETCYVKTNSVISGCQ
jgi:hypothetical protein